MEKCNSPGFQTLPPVIKAIAVSYASLCMHLTSPFSRTLPSVHLSELGCLFHFLSPPSFLYTTLWSGVQPGSQLTPTQTLSLSPVSLHQGSQDAMGAQEGLVPPPYSSFPPPPPPPPQNGLPLDFGGSGIYPAGGQGQVDAPSGITNPPSAPSTLNTQVSVLA